MKTFAICTYGCKINQYDSQALREQLEHRGLREVAPEAPADLYVVNTCTVTATADSEALEYIRRLRRQAPQAAIVAAGCFAEHGAARLRDAGATTILPNRLKPPAAISRFAHRTRAFLKLQDGCRFRCAFCIVPFVRGPGRSRAADAVLDEARRLLDAGHRELVLTGVCLGSFGHDRREHDALARVMERLSALPGEFRLRLSSIEPWGITPRLIAVLRDAPRWCRHLHIPFQSGSDAVLRRMRRPGSWAWYQRLVERMRRAIPRISLSGDLLVGFPGETDADFRQTLALMRACRLMRVHWFPFSVREGTHAATLDGQVPVPVMQARMAEARAAHDILLRRLAREQLDASAVVLTESGGGYTDTYFKVRWTDRLPDNVFMTMRLAAWDGAAFLGTPLARASSADVY